MGRMGLPEGFRTSVSRDVARVELPPLEITTHHVFEPVLTTAHAIRLAEWLAKVQPAPASVVIVHDPRFTDATLTRFRGKFETAIAGFGVHAVVALRSSADETPSVVEPAAPAPAAPAPTEPPKGFDPGAETNHGETPDLEPPSPAVGSAPEGAPPPAPESPERGKPPPPAGSWRRKFEKRR
jgi:hypothetical protein